MEIYHKHILIIKKSKELLKFLEGDEFKKVNTIKKNSEDILKNYEYKEKTVLKIEGYEIGKLKMGLINSFIQAKKTNIKGLIKPEYLPKINEIIGELNFSKNLIESKILLMRRSEWWARKPLEIELNDYLLQEFKKEFINNNPKIIKT